MKGLFVTGVVAVAGVALAGCGTSPSRPHLDPDVAGKPTWGGCREHSLQVSDYTADAPGEKTALAAIASYRTHGDHVVRRPAQDHRAARWLLVDDTNLIHASLELTHTDHGWLVNVVEKCAT